MEVKILGGMISIVYRLPYKLFIGKCYIMQINSSDRENAKRENA